MTTPASDIDLDSASSGPGNFVEISSDAINKMEVKDMKNDLKNLWLNTKGERAEPVSLHQNSMDDKVVIIYENKTISIQRGKNTTTSMDYHRVNVRRSWWPILFQ